MGLGQHASLIRGRDFCPPHAYIRAEGTAWALRCQRPGEQGHAGTWDNWDNVSLRAIVLSWFPPGYLQALTAELGTSCPASTLEPLPPYRWLYHQPVAPGGLLCMPPPLYSWVLEFLIIQPEPMRRGPLPPTRLPTAQEVCYQRAQQAQRESASWLQAAQRPHEKPSSIHIAVPGEKRRIAHVPNPCLATGESWEVRHPVYLQW